MKKVIINKEIKSLTGRPVGMIDGEPMSVRHSMMLLVEGFQPLNKIQSMEAEALGIKITQCRDGNLSLDDKEFKLLETITETNGARLPVASLSPVFKAIDAAENIVQRT